MIWKRARKQSDWSEILQQDANAIEQALIKAAPNKARNLDDVIAQLDDPEQAKVLAYWQRSRWTSTKQTDVTNEMRRVFGTGPRWRKPETRKASKLPPFYPPDKGRE